jgi:hypothetical protein
MIADVVNTRKSERFTVLANIAGSFGAAEMTVLDISVAGLQIEHAHPLKIGTRGRLAFQYRNITVAVQARLIWSHLSPKKPGDDSGKLLYVSGIHLDSADSQFATAIDSLLRVGAIRQDSQSMERKRVRIQEREEARKAQMKALRPF